MGLGNIKSGVNKEVRILNEFKYICSWMLIIVGLALGWYMSFPRSKDLQKQKLDLEAKYSKFIGYSYMVGSIIAIMAYKV